MNRLSSLTSISAFCQVLDLNHNVIGITTDLTPETVHLSLYHRFSAQSSLKVILKRADVFPPLALTVTLNPLDRSMRNEEFDDVVAKIDNPDDFQPFLCYCQKAGEDGLLSPFKPSFWQSYGQNALITGLETWQSFRGFFQNLVKLVTLG